MRSSRSTWIVAGTLSAIAVAAAVYFTNRGYGEVNAKTYDYAKALYSICNRRSEAGLKKIETMIAASAEAGEITETEARWLNDIITDARNGDWKTAAANSRRLLEDQVR